MGNFWEKGSGLAVRARLNNIVGIYVINGFDFFFF